MKRVPNRLSGLILTGAMVCAGASRLIGMHV